MIYERDAQPVAHRPLVTHNGLICGPQIFSIYDVENKSQFLFMSHKKIMNFIDYTFKSQNFCQSDAK